MRARARRARNLSRIACAVTVAVLARTATASAWEFTGRDVDRPAKRVDGERSWSAPVMAEALRARARYVTPPVGVAALLRARPTLRAKLVSYCAVALACAWFVARRALSQTRNALTPRKVRAQRREFQARMMGYRSASARSRSVRGAGEAESSATARAKLENAMRAKREAEGYMVELHALQREFEVSALHKDMIVDSGNPELDVREAYERGLVAGGTKASVAAGDMRRRAEWHATHDLEEAMKSWEAVSAESREHMYEGYQGGWYTANTPLGVPVYVERLGTLDVEKMLKTASVEDIVEQRMRMQGYMIKTLLPEMARRPGSIARDKIVHVIDMKGAGLSLLSSRNIAVFKRLQEVDANFPEFLYRTYVVNVPIGARVVWSTFSGNSTKSSASESSNIRFGQAW
jgi:cell division septation protein DedD